ncbi:MAG: helix-turn-helix domain-containing protein [Alphaproteobacteria bacterium]|nr:helix-turn-helix domain-containing protein [Alphaproteobacteria bacterium]MBF0249922.1 helix-turn-helix domain-containing protein [Alphaproteobacteria bacterium]
MTVTTFVYILGSEPNQNTPQKSGPNRFLERPMARRIDTHWSDVKAALEKKGSCLAEVARSLSVTEAAVHKVKRRPNHRIQTAIAEALSMKPEAIWPTRYFVASGKPIRPVIWLNQNSRRAASAHVKNRKAA